MKKDKTDRCTTARFRVSVPVQVSGPMKQWQAQRVPVRLPVAFSRNLIGSARLVANDSGASR